MDELREVIVGNVCSLCAMVSDSVSSTQKKHSRIMLIQCLSQVFWAAGAIILKGYSGAAQNGVAILRNLAAMKQWKYRVVEWVLIALGVVLGVVFNNRGLLGWLPIVSNLEYSIAVFRFKNREKALKIAFIVNMLLYSVFNLVIRNYVGAIANYVVVATTAISLLRERKKQEAPDEPAE